MRKIRAFIAAAALMVVFVLSAHMVTSGLSLRVDNGRFGFWFNPYKDLSYSALSENIDSDTVLVMTGSSFFDRSVFCFYLIRIRPVRISGSCLFRAGAEVPLDFLELISDN